MEQREKGGESAERMMEEFQKKRTLTRQPGCVSMTNAFCLKIT